MDFRSVTSCLSSIKVPASRKSIEKLNSKRSPTIEHFFKYDKNVIIQNKKNQYKFFPEWWFLKVLQIVENTFKNESTMDLSTMNSVQSKDSLK